MKPGESNIREEDWKATKAQIDRSADAPQESLVNLSFFHIGAQKETGKKEILS